MTHEAPQKHICLCKQQAAFTPISLYNSITNITTTQFAHQQIPSRIVPPVSHWPYRRLQTLTGPTDAYSPSLAPGPVSATQRRPTPPRLSHPAPPCTAPSQPLSAAPSHPSSASATQRRPASATQR